MTAARAVLAALLAGGAPAAQAEAPAPRPDVLLVVLDDVGWPEVALAPTPALDAFARRGTTWRRFYVSPLCSPSRYALLFGRHGFRAGLGTALRTVEDPDCPGAPLADTSLAEHLRAAGYATGAFGKWHLSSTLEGPVAEAARRHGFDVWRAGVVGNVADYFDWERVDDGEVSRSTVYNTTAVADAALAWWSEAPAPRFAYVAFQAVHHPVQPPPRELLDPIDPGAPGAPSGGPPVPAALARRRLPVDYRDLYRALDHELGRLLAGVDPERTLVWIVSDNGPPPHLSLAGPGAKNSVGEAGVHVPAWSAGPGVPAGRASDELVQAVDLFAAVAAAAGAPIPAGVAEDSLVPGTRTEAFVQLFAPNGGGERVRDERAAILADPPLKLVRDEQGERLYDLAADPWERQRLRPSKVDPELVTRLRAALELPERVLAAQGPR